MNLIAGIDLGTTNSAIAVLSEIGKSEIVPNKEGERITPSLIIFDGKVVVVGHHAKERENWVMPHEAGCFVREIKREMSNQDYRLSIFGETYTPTSLSSLILKKTISGVPERRHGQLGPVAISVPAYFYEAERRATYEAGKLAGLDVVSIVDEPVAAALAYSETKKLDGTYLVFDLGGGTFDIAILSAKDKHIEVLNTDGDQMLGGSDFDAAIFKDMCDAYLSATGEELTLDQDGKHKAGEIRGRALAQKVKHMLSQNTSAKLFPLLNAAGGQTMTYELSRDKFNSLISRHLTTAEMLLEQALEDANMDAGDIDEVLLVGGSTRVPAVAKIVKDHFGSVPTTTFNPDEIVALGAGIHAGTFVKNRQPEILSKAALAALEPRETIHAITHSYGMIAVNSFTGELMNVIMLEKNTPLPASYEHTFFTGYEDQRGAHCQVTQGEETDPAFLPEPIFETRLPLPPGRPDNKPIKVKFTCEDGHILHCRFQDAESGALHEVRVDLIKGKGDVEGDDVADVEELEVI